MEQTLFQSKRDALSVLGWAALVASPFLLLLILSLVLGQNAFDLYPVWGDELAFWRELYSWNEMGFRTGYYGMLENIAPVGTLGISGIGPLLIYGWFVKLFGMTNYTIMLCNAVWASLTALVFCVIRRPRPAVSFTLAAFMLCYAPMVLYCVTSMTECFNYALMLLYLAFLLAYQEKRKPWLLALCCATVVFGCLYRPMYALLFLPVILFFCRYRFGARMLGSGLAALLLAAACAYIAQLSAAPDAQGYVYHLLRAPDVQTFVRMLLSHTKANLSDYFIRAAHSAMQIAFRYLYCGTTLLCLAGSFLSVERSGGRLRLKAGYHGPIFSCFCLLAAAFAFTMLFYRVNDWQDFRRLAPFLFLVTAYLIARHRFLIPRVTLAICLATLVLLIARPEGAFVDSGRFSAPEAPESLPEVLAAIPYDAQAANPFDNTIRTDVMSYSLARGLHPGLGIQSGWMTTENTGKSRWILTDQLKCPLNDYENVLDTGDYKLYRRITPLKEE